MVFCKKIERNERCPMRQFKTVERYGIRSDNINRYYVDVNKHDMLTLHEENCLAIKAKNGDEEAREKLVVANLRFVISVAKSYTGGGTKLEDLISQGNYGLILASRRFDPSMGFRFISYAIWHIRNEIIKYLSEYSRQIRLPINRVQDLKKINSVHNDYVMQYGVEPDAIAISEELKKIGVPLDVDVIERILETDAKMTPLDGTGDEDEAKPINLIESDEFDVAAMTDSMDLGALKANLYKELLPHEIDIVERRLGLRNSAPESFSSIANDLDISNTTAVNRYQRVIKKIKKTARKLKQSQIKL